ncbi:hypothetical protein GGE67_004335 [Rhizobium leucaenae]|uniref:Uncharacterized protein n=1 Tax=Rhizobium leucaenae TaxID=29450 RepID=A0A7W7EMQ4_9HYPH|nr:hypothetical protein [Rhizobium leucaenae]MBB6303694.1 hypothetical protein [Rhizobium leucaenae]
MSERQRAVEGRFQHAVAGDCQTDAEDVAARGVPAGEKFFDRRFDPPHLYGERRSFLRNFHVFQWFSEPHETEANRADVHGDAERQAPVLAKRELGTGRSGAPGFRRGKDNHASIVKSPDDPVQRLLGEFERLGQIRAFDSRRFPDESQKVSLIAGCHTRRLRIPQKMVRNVV